MNSWVEYVVSFVLKYLLIKPIEIGWGLERRRVLKFTRLRFQSLQSTSMHDVWRLMHAWFDVWVSMRVHFGFSLV